jgi:tRNA A58 N-methylase Trm61
MEQTPAHEQHNPDLLKLIPVNAVNLIEVGCSSGALARAFKKKSPNCHYIGIEVDPNYALIAKRYCDETFTLDIENADDFFWKKNSDRDCWIFGDTLEHLKDPWRILAKIRTVIPHEGSIVVCIPNAQHWSLQVKLSVGDFKYQDRGLLDRTHLRWFTRKTMIEMFQSTGYEVIARTSRIFNEPKRDLYLPIIEKLASLAGADPKAAALDAIPIQYVLRVIPK